ncbi:hypothetical protein ES703_32569 [subsurface metagenome]
MRLTNPTNGAIPYPLNHETVAFIGMTLVAHLGHNTGLPGRLGYCAGFIDVMGHRFLGVDMLTRFYGSHWWGS